MSLEHLDSLTFCLHVPAIEQAVEEKLGRLEGSRLARECAKLDPGFEQGLAEEGLAQELKKWPEY